MELVKVAVMGLSEAKDLKSDLQKSDVELVLNHNDQTCTRGCAVTVEVHAREADIPKVLELYQARYMKLLEGHDINPDILNAVYDSEASEATCPACGHNFSPNNKECPDCGLVLG